MEDDVYRMAVKAAGKIGIREEDIAETEYFGDAERYLILTEHIEPVFFGDDTPLADEYVLDFELYLPPEDAYRKTEQTFRLALEAEGFSEVILENQMYDNEAEKRHITISASYTRMREQEELWHW